MSDSQLITCTPTPIAYLDEVSPHDRGQLNLVGDVKMEMIHDGAPIPGGDGAPIIVDAGCGRDFRIDYEPWAWDVNTEIQNGLEVVVERHLAVSCPTCGRTADYLSEIVENPYEFSYQGLSKSQRLLLSDPEMIDWLGEPPAGVNLVGMLREGPPEDRELRRWWRLINGVSGGGGGGYAHVTEGAVALVAATAKSVIGGKAGSAVGLLWAFYNLAFDGVSASQVPVTMELCYCTFGANSPGTNSTGTAERQEYGRVIAADWTGGRNWTTEPTTITVLGEGSLTPNGGLILYDDPLSCEPDSAVSEGFVIRLTAAAAVNVRASQKFRHA